MKVRLNPGVVAALLVVMMKRYAEERERVITRIRFSRKTMLRVSGRKRSLRSSFLDELDEALSELGYVLIIDEPDFGLMPIDTSGWPKISSKRIADEIRKARVGKLTEDDLLAFLPDEATSDEEVDD